MRGDDPHAADDNLARDNVFHFVVSPSEPVHALVVSRGGAEREALYLDARAGDRRSAARRADRADVDDVLRRRRPRRRGRDAQRRAGAGRDSPIGWRGSSARAAAC